MSISPQSQHLHLAAATRLIYKTTLTTIAATANIDINHIERVDGQFLPSQARCIRYTRHSAQPSDAAAIPTMNIVDDAKLLINTRIYQLKSVSNRLTRTLTQKDQKILIGAH
jgi:hypothetical protein